MAVWDRAAPLLDRVVKEDTGHTLDSVLNRLQLGRMLLWIIDDFKAVAVTEIVCRPLHRIVWVHFIAGKDMINWLDELEDAYTHYAIRNRCRAVEFCGREGWRKHMKQHTDWDSVLTLFRKEVSL